MKNLLFSLTVIFLSMSAFAQVPGWMHVIGGSGATSISYGLNIDSNGSIINCGAIYDDEVVGGLSLKEGGYVLKYSKDGKVLRSFNVGPSVVTSCFETTNEDFILDFDSTYGVRSYGAVARVRANGSRIWTHVYEMFSYNAYKVVLGPGGHPLHLGSVVDGKIKYATITSLHKTTGQKRWTKRVRVDPNKAFYDFRDAVFNDKGMIYVIMGDSKKTVLMALDSNGKAQDSIYIDGQVTKAGLEHKNGKLILAGNFNEELTIDGTSIKPYPENLSIQSGLVAIFDTKLELVQHTSLGSFGGKKSKAPGRVTITGFTVDDDLNILISGAANEMLVNKGDTLFKRDIRTGYVLSLDKNLDFNWLFTPDRFSVVDITHYKKTVFITGSARAGQRYGSHVVDSKLRYNNGVYTAELNAKEAKQNDVELEVRTQSQVSDSQILPLANKWFEAYYMSGGDSKRFTGKTDAQGILKVTLKDVDESSYVYGSFFYVCDDQFEERANGSFYYTGTENILSIVAPCEFTVYCKADFTLSLGKLANDTVTLSDGSYTNIGTLNYAWDFGDNTVERTRYPNHYYKNDGTYKLCLSIEAVKDTVACWDTLCRTLTVQGSNNGFYLVVESPVSIADAPFEKLPIQIFPNPAQYNEFTISSEKEVQLQEMVLYNFSGEEVRRFDIAYLRAGDNQFSLEALKAGMYFIDIVTPTARKQVRLIKL